MKAVKKISSERTDKVVQLRADPETPKKKPRGASVVPTRVPRARRRPSQLTVSSQLAPPMRRSASPAATHGALRLIANAFAELGPMIPARAELLAVIRPELAPLVPELLQAVDEGALRLIVIGYEPHFTAAQPLARAQGFRQARATQPLTLPASPAPSAAEPPALPSKRGPDTSGAEQQLAGSLTESARESSSQSDLPALDTDLELATMLDVEHERVLLYRVVLVVEALVAFALLRGFWVM